MPSVLQAVVFDMDGVLFDSEPLHIRSWQAVLEPLDFEEDPSWYRQWIGVADVKMAQWLETNGGLGLSAQTLLERKRAAYRELIRHELRIFPGLSERIETLGRMDLRLGLCTSSNRAEALGSLEQAGMDGRFEAMVCGDDVEHNKPAPDPYLKIIDELGVSGETVVVLEDSPSGIESARVAGACVLGIASSAEGEQLGRAHQIFGSTVEAVDWLIDRYSLADAAN